jgi:hypothetical protein
LPAASLHSTAARRGATEDRMKELGIELPAYQDAVWSYVKAQCCLPLVCAAQLFS